MIVYLKNNEIDREQWDSCIRNSFSVKPYGHSWYLDIMAPGWEALIDDDYDSVFPVPRYSRLGVQYVATPPFIQQLGAFSPDKPASGMISEFLEYMPRIFKLVDINVGQKTDYPGFSITEKINYELNLSYPYSELWERFTPECHRVMSNRSFKRFELSSDITPEELTDLYLKNPGLRLRGRRLIDFERLRQLMHYCISEKKGKIIGARATKKRAVFGAFVVRIRRSQTILFTAASFRTTERLAGYYVINDIIKTSASTSAILDFAGSSEVMGKSFGASRVPYYRLYRNRLLWPAGLIK